MFRKNNKKNKNKQVKTKSVSKFRGNRNSVVKSKNRKKRKFQSYENENTDNSKKPTKEVVESSSESSEDEIEDPLKQLLCTFNPEGQNKQNLAVESEDEDESDDSSIENEVEKTLQPNETSDGEANQDGVAKQDGDENDADDISDPESEEEITTENLQAEDLNLNDSFVNHLCYDLSDDFSDFLQNRIEKNVETLDWPYLGKMAVSLPKYSEEVKENKFTIVEQKKCAPLGKVSEKLDLNHLDPINFGIKSQIAKNIKNANPETQHSGNYLFTSIQNELFSLINNYQDIFYPERNLQNGEEIRFLYSLHAINHILKTRIKILHHNAKLKNKSDISSVLDDYRDQGLVRPKVLIIVPFRDSALRIVKMFMDILTPGENGQVINKKRFLDDFSGNELQFPKKNPKPEDYEQLFAGNTDDAFKIGIKIGKKSLGLYSDFYKSDIIIGSPLGLRMVVGAAGEVDRDFDFLNSIELLILDQAELFLMQNWDHLVHIVDHLHLQPKNSHGTDFSRVRNWALNGFSKYYRQTLIFSNFIVPEINSIFNKKCFNYSGSVKIVNPVKDPAILKITVSLPQIFRKFSSDSFLNCIEDRFNFFITKILPNFKESVMKNTLIFVPSYFDFVKIRNFFKKEDLSFVQICEYSKESKVARARDIFFHGDKHFLIYSERYHFFHRIRLKGIRHVIFYQPPVFSNFYSEICNLMQESNQNKKVGNSSNMSVTVLYSKYDLQQLSGIVGSERAYRMANSEKNYHMITTSDN